MEIGRTSCTSFWANQLRVLMTAAAYVLLQELRSGLAGTASARAQVSTLRAFSETRSSRGYVGASHRAALAAVVSLSP